MKSRLFLFALVLISLFSVSSYGSQPQDAAQVTQPAPAAQSQKSADDSKTGNDIILEAWNNRNESTEDTQQSDQKVQFWDRSESDAISSLEKIIGAQTLFPDMSVSLQSIPSDNQNIYLAVVNGVMTGVGYSYLADTDLGKDNLTLLSTNALTGNDAEAFALLADAMIVESDPSGQYSDLLSANQLLGRLIDNATANKGSAEEIVSAVKYKLVVSPTASIFVVKPVQ